jgi:hypothetical protein
MNKTLILFSHHFVEEYIEDRFKLLKKINKDCDIKAIGFKDSKNLLTESIIVDTKKYPNNEAFSRYFDKHTNWSETDLFLYEAYFQYPNYDKYFLLEYDTIFNTSIETFFPKIKECNHFGSNVYNDLNDENWIFYKIYKEKNEFSLELEETASIGQTSCIYVNNELLSLISKEIIEKKEIYSSMNAELRLGTLIKKFNKFLIKSREDIGDYISWDESNIKIDLNKKEFFYHPAKKIHYNNFS